MRIGLILTAGSVRGDVDLALRAEAAGFHGVFSIEFYNRHGYVPLAAIAQASAPQHTDGINILPTLIDQNELVLERYLYWEFFEGGFKQAERLGHWKAIRSKIGEALELYDLSKDISETSNIAKQQPEVIEKIETYLKTARTESKGWPIP